MSGTNTIHVNDLVVEHPTASGPLRVLNCPELKIAGGTTTAITGRSGSGKSTLLGVLAGLGMPTKGSVTIGSTNVTDLPEPQRVAFRRDAIGLVYQADNLLPFLTVAENIQLQLALCGDSEETEERIADLLDRLGLGDLGDRLPDQLSGGQRQRVAVARAIVHRPTVILADEPTGALDEANATAVIQLLLDAHQRLGSTLVLVTHDLSIARAMGRIVELREGSIVTDHQGS
jgi:putative ABC transport system ATP-binding protein